MLQRSNRTMPIYRGIFFPVWTSACPKLCYSYVIRWVSGGLTVGEGSDKKIFTVILSFRKCKKNSPVLQQILKMLPSQHHAVRMLVEHFILWCSCPAIVQMIVCTHHTQNTNFSVLKREFIILSFLYSNTGCYVGKTKPHYRKTLNVRQFLIVYRLKKPI